MTETKQITEKITLACADSRKPENIPALEFDLVIWDPMYKTKTTQNDYKPIRRKNQAQMEYLKPMCPPLEEYDQWFTAWVNNSADHVKKTGWIIIKVDDFTAYEEWPILKELLRWENTIIWNKKIIGLGRRLRKQHELLLILRPQKAEHSYFFGKNIIQTKHLKQTGFHGGSKGKAVSTLWTTTGYDDDLNLEDETVWDALGNNGGQLGTKIKKRHINETITDIWEKAIDVFVPQNGSILDLCMGSGSIAVAAKHKNRSYYGIEIQENIFKKACENVQYAAGPTSSLDTYTTETPKQAMGGL